MVVKNSLGQVVPSTCTHTAHTVHVSCSSNVTSTLLWFQSTCQQRKLSARSDRVKCVDVHPTEPWMLASLYNGNVHVWNYESQTLVKTFEVTDLPGMIIFTVFAAHVQYN